MWLQGTAIANSVNSVDRGGKDGRLQSLLLFIDKQVWITCNSAACICLYTSAAAADEAEVVEVGTALLHGGCGIT